jgi:hypothetical protein
MMNDLKDIDKECKNDLKSLKAMGANTEYVCIDFTQAEEMLGMKNAVDLIPTGERIKVIEANLHEFVVACLKYCLLG